MRQNKKPRITPIQDSGLITPPRAEQQRNSIRFPFVSNLFTQINVNDLPKLNHKDPLKVIHFYYFLITMFKSIRFITRF